MTKSKAPATIAAANGIATDTAHAAVTPPIYLSSTFAFAGYNRAHGYDYTRTANPTRDLLSDTLAKLEGAAGAIVTASGMAAVDLVLSTVRPGEFVIAPHDCYGGTQKLLRLRQQNGQFEVAFIDQTDKAALSAAFKEGPSLIYVETPSNPLMRVVDVQAVAGEARSVGAKTVVDNTFLSPALQRPIERGADFVVHSTTKYLNGHSDVVGGAVLSAASEDHIRLAETANITGVSGAPFDSYLTLRGLRTLYLRMQRQQENAAAVADFLAAHPAVSVVHYPGLASHPGHEIARAQQDGFGAMLSFELAEGIEAVPAFLERPEVFTLAESLGGVESLVAHPATMTHVSMGAEARENAGISDALIRLSIGIEDKMDLVADLDQALRRHRS